ncbi:MAG: glycoside hydrolase family 15 protein [Deltaproteobacteria bacterium]
MHASRKPHAPGSPGVEAHWADANKDLIGTAVGAGSRVWFTYAGGILTEVFFPTPDQACLRSFELAVVAADGMVSEEKAHTVHGQTVVDPQVPFCRFVNVCVSGRYRIDKEVIADPLADVILVRARFTVLAGDTSSLGRVYCLLAPHLGNHGDDNTALLGAHEGTAMLFAERADGLALALACSAPIVDATAGFAGADGRAQLREHGKLVERFDRAEHGNVSLAAELDHRATHGEITFALGFARTRDDAAHAALTSLHRGFDAAHARYVSEWKGWHAGLRAPAAARPLWTTSATVLKTLEAKTPTGGRVAALATPWGPSRGPGIEGTYHLVWTRDLVQSATGLLAAGAADECRLALPYLRATQHADGHWPQNMQITGARVWSHDELDEVGLPLLLVSRLRAAGLISDAELDATWPMMVGAARWITRHGPSTPRDRWEDTSGVTPFSIATAIAGLLCAAEVAELLGHHESIAPLRDLADEWNDGIESMLYRRGGALADRVGVAGYYVRSRHPGQPYPDLDLDHLPPTEVSPDALALVRFGLRAADDPKMVDTVRVIDATLRCELPSGPAWRRYPGDKYGEYADGAPFDGDGIGRPWPLLTGERAHYEIARGRLDEAAKLAFAIEGFANATGCVSEQVWDQPDLPACGLVRGKPTRSAAPLGWAHAEYLTLCRSLAAGRVFDLPSISYDRYVAPRR